jgi:hypothetical protein
MIRTYAAMTLLSTVLLIAATAFPQSSDRLPVTDAEKIADVLRAGPAFITKDATVLDRPSARGDEYRLLPKGLNEWAATPYRQAERRKVGHATVRACSARQ